MQKTYSLNVILICLTLFTVNALAKDVIVSVAKSKRGACNQGADHQAVVHNLTVKETIRALEDYVHQKKNAHLYDAAFMGPGLRFCGTDERTQVFGHLVKELRAGEPPKRLFEVIANYSGSQTLLELIQKELKKKNLGKRFEDNLRRAENLILETRKSPQPNADANPAEATGQKSDG